MDSFRTSEAAAMTSSARIPLIQPGTRPELAQVERSIATERGGISPLYQALLNSAPIASGWEKFLTAVRKHTTVPPALRELVILRIAVLNGATFEFDEHVSPARAAGVSDAKMEAVKRWRMGSRKADDADPFDDDDRLALELADAMTRDIEVPDALMNRLAARFDARGVLEIVATVAAYNMVSRLLVALRIRHGGSSPSRPS
jgi:4-carboxymuconolactone decarboxylase